LKALLAMLILLFGNPPGASTQAGDQKDRFDLLLRAEALDDSAVGEVTYKERAVRTGRYEQFSRLYRAGSTSSGTAKRLVNSASPAGRIYGYLILLHVSPRDAAAVTPGLLRDHAPVDVRNGCIASKSTVAEVVAQIQKGSYVIQLPRQ
jgi:hypothetical protein